MVGVEEDLSSGLTTNLSIALGSLLVLFLFLSLGGYCFSLYEQISFFDGFYFCFITMTTIGYLLSMRFSTLTLIHHRHCTAIF